MEKKRTTSGRTFTLSLKPSWSLEMVERLGDTLKGVAELYSISHNQDTNENGEPIETHTHFVISYKQPRKISTIANLFGVADNFVEVARSKQAVLLYLTHKNATDKHQYSPEEVYSNGVPYSIETQRDNLSNTEILEHIRKGTITDILDIVPPNKINQISQVERFVLQKDTNQIVRRLENKVETLEDKLDKVSVMFDTLAESLTLTLGEMPKMIGLVLEQIQKELTKQEPKKISKSKQ